MSVAEKGVINFFATEKFQQFQAYRSAAAGDKDFHTDTSNRKFKSCRHLFYEH